MCHGVARVFAHVGAGGAVAIVAAGKDWYEVEAHSDDEVDLGDEE